MDSPVTRTQNLVGKDQVFLARLVSSDATGVAVAGEGKALLAADVSTLTCTVYDQSSQTPGVAVSQPTVTISSAMSALVIDNNWARLDATTGRNFIHQVPGSAFSVAEHTYRVVYDLTTTGGTAIGWYHLHVTEAKAPS